MSAKDSFRRNRISQRKRFCLLIPAHLSVFCRLSVTCMPFAKLFQGFRCHLTGTLWYPTTHLFR